MSQLTAAQRNSEWITARLGRVTASLAAACLGLDPYRSARAAWREIMACPTEAEINEYATNRHMQRGVEFEASARLCYEETTGLEVVETGFWVSDEYPFLGASPDGLIGCDGALECKCPMDRREATPLHHRIQCLIQLACTGRQWVDYFSWPAPPQKPFLQRIFSSPGTESLIRRLEAWYLCYVVGGEEPPRKKPKRKKARVD